MSVHNRVIWSEGLFLQPQHFQQQERYCEPLVPYSWGFTAIEFERDFLKIGKVGFRRLAGVFPDGTPFRMPDDDPLPAPIDIQIAGLNAECSAICSIRTPKMIALIQHLAAVCPEI